MEKSMINIDNNESQVYMSLRLRERENVVHNSADST